jgi:hypothetical protein
MALIFSIIYSGEENLSLEKVSKMPNFLLFGLKIGNEDYEVSL